MELTPQFQESEARTKGPYLQLITALFFLFTSVLFTSCEEGKSHQVLQRSTGLPGEVIVVLPEDQWQGEVGDSIRKVLMAPFPMILQLEPMFSVIHKTPDQFYAVDRALRNILLIEISADAEPGAKQVSDRWARPQMVYSIRAKDAAGFVELWATYGEAIAKDIRKKDRERLTTYTASVDNYLARNQLSEKMGLQLTLHKDFKAVKVGSEVSSFLRERIQYLSGRPHDVKQGIVVYTYPYDSDSMMTSERLNAKRNEVLGALVRSVNDAPMTIEMRLPPTYTRVAHDSLYAVEGRGLWRMQDPIQGGTFVSLTVIDEKKNRVVTVDGYVFSPQFDKRPLLLEIEAYVHSLKLEV